MQVGNKTIQNIPKTHWKKLDSSYSFSSNASSLHRRIVYTRNEYFLPSYTVSSQYACEQHVCEWIKIIHSVSWASGLPLGIWLVNDSLKHTSSNCIKKRTKSTYCVRCSNLLLIPEPVPWQPLLQNTTENLDPSRSLLNTQNRHCVYAVWYRCFAHERISCMLNRNLRTLGSPMTLYKLSGFCFPYSHKKWLQGAGWSWKGSVRTVQNCLPP